MDQEISSSIPDFKKRRRREELSCPDGRGWVDTNEIEMCGWPDGNCEI
jgi:hypothetical protein